MDPEEEANYFLAHTSGDPHQAAELLKERILPPSFRPCEGDLWVTTWNHLRAMAGLPEKHVVIRVPLDRATRRKIRGMAVEEAERSITDWEHTQLCAEWAVEKAFGSIPLQLQVKATKTKGFPRLWWRHNEFSHVDYVLLAHVRDDEVALHGFIETSALQGEDGEEGIPEHHLHPMFFWDEVFNQDQPDSTEAMSKPKTIIVIDFETAAFIPQALFESMVKKAQAKIKPEKPKSNNPKQETLDRIEREYEEKLAAVPDEIIGKAALSPMTGRIVAVGIGVKRPEEGWQFSAKVAPKPDDEKTLLQELDAILADPPTGQVLLVTYNGRRFDLPFMAARAMVHGLEVDYPIPLGYQRQHHLDLHADVLGGDIGGSLENWCLLFGGDPKVLDGGGAAVAGLVENEEWDKIEAYALDDAKKTAAIYSRASRVVTW